MFLGSYACKNSNEKQLEAEVISILVVARGPRCFDLFYFVENFSCETKWTENVAEIARNPKRRFATSPPGSANENSSGTQRSGIIQPCLTRKRKYHCGETVLDDRTISNEKNKSQRGLRAKI